MTVRSYVPNEIEFFLYEALCIHRSGSDVANIQKCGLIEQDINPNAGMIHGLNTAVENLTNNNYQAGTA